MDRKKIQEINKERLGKWGDDLVDYHATPVLIVGVSHDDHSGEIHVITVENIPDEQLIMFLTAAVDKLIKRR